MARSLDKEPDISDLLEGLFLKNNGSVEVVISTLPAAVEIQLPVWIFIRYDARWSPLPIVSDSITNLTTQLSSFRRQGGDASSCVGRKCRESMVVGNLNCGLGKPLWEIEEGSLGQLPVDEGKR